MRLTKQSSLEGKGTLPIASYAVPASSQYRLRYGVVAPCPRILSVMLHFPLSKLLDQPSVLTAAAQSFATLLLIPCRFDLGFPLVLRDP